MDHVGRWDDMTFDFPINILLPFILGSDLRFPLLRRLSLRGRIRVAITDEHPPPIPPFQKAPLLSQLCFHHFPYCPLFLSFPWSRITELKVYSSPGLTIYHLLDGLKHTSNLSSLGFWQFFAPSPPPTFVPATQPDQVVQLPHLRTLSWQTYLSNDILFFDWICAPRLSEVAFSCKEESWDTG